MPSLLSRNGTIYVTILVMVDILEYQDQGGGSPFRKWFDRLNAEAAGKVMTAIYRIRLGNFSNTTGVGRGVYECSINFGPGYRVYFAKDGELVIILLGGGTKNASGTISRLRSNDGKTTSKESDNRERNEYGFNERFSTNGSGSRETRSRFSPGFAWRSDRKPSFRRGGARQRTAA